MDLALDQQQDLIVRTIRRFSERELAEAAADADRTGTPPPAILDGARELGFVADAIPEAHGGLLDGSYSHLERSLRSIELGRACASLAALLESSVEPALAVGRWGQDALQAQLFESLTDGGGIAATASDFGNRVEVTCGSKTMVHGRIGPMPAGAIATHALLCARDRDGVAVVMVIPRSAAVVTPTTPSGWRAARWATWNVDHLAGDEISVLARGDDATAIASEILAWVRVNLAARAVGVAMTAMEHAAAYGQERVQFGQPIGTFESIAGMRDRNQTAVRAARLLVLEAAWMLDKGHADAIDTASRARAFANDVVAQATVDAVQIYGGYGFVTDYPVEKLMRDARPFEALHGDESFARVLDQRAPA